jgi:hypothetical protein
MSSDLEWRVALLSIVFLIDLVVFAGLCRQELRDWRVQRSTAKGMTFAFARAVAPIAEEGVS